MAADAVYTKGIALKEDMWGPEAGQAKIDAATDFTREFEELVARYCFGEVWGREQLPRATRSLLTIAMLLALGRPHELQVHVRGAVANGVTKEQIREVIIHAAIYCGVPAAVDGFRQATEALKKLDVQ